MSQGPANPEKCGKKIDESEYVWIITSHINQSTPDAKLIRMLKEKYGFKVSLPSLLAFKRNYYPTRLTMLKKETIKFKQEQTGQIQTFIDESLRQADAIEVEIGGMTKQVELVTRQLDFVRKFECLFQNAIDRYVDAYDPASPDPFLYTSSPKSEAQRLLTEVVTGMGEEGRNALVAYVQTRNAFPLVKLFTLLTAKLKDLRMAKHDIHKNIFKSYRNLSISQEMTVIFERYNGIIVEEFFPDKSNIDAQKFARVNQKVRALFDELNTRYQGVETPSDHGRNPTTEEIQKLDQGIMPTSSPIEEPALKGQKGRQPAKSTVIARERAKAAATTAVIEDTEDSEIEPTSMEVEPPDSDTTDYTPEEAATVYKEIETQAAEPDLFRQALGDEDTRGESHAE